MTWLRELIAMRHGESRANAAFIAAAAEGRVDFDLDGADWSVPLSPLGQRQATQAGAHLAASDEPIDAVFTSTYVRAQETAALVLAALANHDRPAPPLINDERLRDRELGVLEARTPGQIEREFPEEIERQGRVGSFYYRPPGGESFPDVIARVRDFLRDLRDPYQDQRVLVVAHHGIVLALRYILEGLTPEETFALVDVRNAGLTRWVSDNDRMHLRAFNESGHLTP